MKFQDWAAEFGGLAHVAVALDVTPFSVRNWIQRSCIPRPKTIIKLVALSKGKLTMESIVNDTMPPEKAPAAPKKKKRG